VELKIFDLRGREVKVLVDEIMKAGVSEIEFNGQDLASAIYFYQLKGEHFTRTKKMILLR
jgi:hypothetical protein